MGEKKKELHSLEVILGRRNSQKKKKKEKLTFSWQKCRRGRCVQRVEVEWKVEKIHRMSFYSKFGRLVWKNSPDPVTQIISQVKSPTQRAPARKEINGEEALLRRFYWKTETRFLSELINRLDCQTKAEHKNSPCPQKRSDSRLPSSSLTFTMCLFYLAWSTSDISLVRAAVAEKVISEEISWKAKKERERERKREREKKKTPVGRLCLE